MRLTAPAKLTLALRVTGVRTDGYHLIDAEMVTLDLADTLEISAGDGLAVRFAPPASERSGLDVGDPERMRAVVASRKPGVVAGTDAALLAFKLIDPAIEATLLKGDGSGRVQR